AGEGAPRYRMLDTIKEYAAQRLVEAGGPEPARQAHLGYFTELTETAEPQLRRAGQLEWLAILEAEHDNIGAAMRGAIAAGAAQPAAGAGCPTGTHVAGAGRLLVRVRAVAGLRGPLGKRPGPVPPRQDADHARPGQPGSRSVSGDGARRVPDARRTLRDFAGP